MPTMEYYPVRKKVPSPTDEPTDKMNKRKHYMISLMQSSGKSKLVHHTRSQGSSDFQGWDTDQGGNGNPGIIHLDRVVVTWE